MAIYQLPFENVKLVEKMTLWGWYTIPVFSLNEIQSRADLEAAISNSDSFQYGTKDDNTLPFFIGTPREMLETAVAQMEYSKPITNNSYVTVSSEEIPYSSYHVRKRVIYNGGVYDGYGLGQVILDTFSEESTSLSSIIESRCEPRSKVDLVNIWESGSGFYGGYLMFVENGIKYYARCAVILYYIIGNIERAPLIINLNVNTYYRDRLDTFFGAKGNTALTIDQINGATTEEITDNPYGPGGDSGEGGGGGSFDNDSDQITDSSLPTLSAANTGFTRIYNPTLAQVQDLARYLWTDESVITTIWNHIKQYFEDPMQAIIGFNLVPVPVPDGGTQNFALMYIDTGVQMTVAANQFVDVDCGTLDIVEYYGSALDYSPYTKISCFLPFIGTVQLNVDEVMGRTLQVKYRVDICSGSCVAKILVDGNVMYQYSGHCAITIPISSADFSSYVNAAVSVAKLAIGAAVGGGMGAIAAAGEDPSQQTNQVVTRTITTETARNPTTGRQITTGTRSIVETRESPANQSGTQASYVGLTPENVTNTVGQIMSSKPHVEHSGSFSGNTGYLGVRRPYVIIQRPRMCMPSQYQSFNGFPCMITLPLSECTGFTKIQQVQLTGFPGTNPEQSEILQLLKSGVIL